MTWYFAVGQSPNYNLIIMAREANIKCCLWKFIELSNNQVPDLSNFCQINFLVNVYMFSSFTFLSSTSMNLLLAKVLDMVDNNLLSVFQQNSNLWQMNTNICLYSEVKQPITWVDLGYKRNLFSTCTPYLRYLDGMLCAEHECWLSQGGLYSELLKCNTLYAIEV